MKQTILKTAWCLGVAMALTATGFAQDSKIKVEEKDYKMKYKEDGNEYKLEEKGTLQRRTETMQVEPVTRTSSHVQEGQSVTTVKYGERPVAEQQTTTAPVAKKSYAARNKYASKKSCACKKVAAKKPASKRAVAYKPKAKKSTVSTVAKTTTVTPAIPAPVVVTDTVYVSRVDTVFSVMERDVFTGYSQGNTIPVSRDFKELKLEKEDGELNLKIEYEDGSEIKRTFSNTRDLNLYMEPEDEQKESLREY